MEAQKTFGEHQSTNQVYRVKEGLKYYNPVLVLPLHFENASIIGSAGCFLLTLP